MPGAGEYTIEPDDVDSGLPPDGTPMPLGDVVERMIVVSSNEATNIVTERVGLPAVNKVLADAGATGSVFGRKYSDLAAEQAGASHRTTAADLCLLMSALVTGRLAGPERTAWMCEMLGRQADRQLTPPYRTASRSARSPAGWTASGTTSRSWASPVRTPW